MDDEGEGDLTISMYNNGNSNSSSRRRICDNRMSYSQTGGALDGGGMKPHRKRRPDQPTTT